MVFCSSLMLEKSSNHSSSTRDLKIPLAFVMNKTPYSHFLLTVFTQCLHYNWHQYIVNTEGVFIAPWHPAHKAQGEKEQGARKQWIYFHM